MHRLTKELLDLLADLDDDVLADVYNLVAGDDAPLDSALFAWRSAGCPDAVLPERPLVPRS